MCLWETMMVGAAVTELWVFGRLLSCTGLLTHSALQWMGGLVCSPTVQWMGRCSTGEGRVPPAHPQCTALQCSVVIWCQSAFLRELALVGGWLLNCGRVGA